MDKVFYAGNAIFFVVCQSTSYWPCTWYTPGTCSIWAQHICLAEVWRRSERHGYLTLILLTHGELITFHRLMKYWEPLSVRKAHPSSDNYSYKCAAGLNTLLVEYLLMQCRHLTGEARSAKTREEAREANGGIPLLTDLCMAMRSDPVGWVVQGSGRGGDLCLWACRDVRLPGSACGSVPTFGGAREPVQRSGWDGNELVPKRRLESAN